MTYNEALNFILNKQSLGIMPGLTRISKLLDNMDNPQNKLNIIHIAGTNGKGTVANSIANVLSNNGFKVGLFTSPWISDYREQIKINNEPISEDDFAYLIDKYKDADATEFELLTAIMYKYFANKNVDYAVIECGMGGLEDATNVEDKNISVLTSISVDHTSFLGDTIDKIAYQKAGIIKDNSVCIMYPNKQIENIVKAQCEKKKAKLIIANDNEDYNKVNLSLVKNVITQLGYDFESKLYFPPARKTRINNILIDGGHNLEAGASLSKIIDNEVALIGMMADKDVDGYLKQVASKCKSIVVTTPSNPRSMQADELMTIAKIYCDNVISIDNPSNALSYAKQNGLSLVCGSFYLIREIYKDLFN